MAKSRKNKNKYMILKFKFIFTTYSNKWKSSFHLKNNLKCVKFQTKFTNSSAVNHKEIERQNISPSPIVPMVNSKTS